MDKQYHHGDLKTELIKGGLQMIRENGIEKLSLRRLASLCEVSESAPYSHFKNKDELLRAIQEYITEQLQDHLRNAYEETEQVDSPVAILNMGKTYVLFFMKYPAYYTFLFTQPEVRIDLSMHGGENDFAPFRFFRERAFHAYRNAGFSEQRIKFGVIAMWAKVHGIAAIASMKCVEKDFEWEDVLEEILLG